MVGDEGELFERYHARLVKVTAYRSRASREIVEEACSFAWATLLRRDDVDRDTVFAWLKEVARNEAWRLERLDHEHVPLDAGPGGVDPELLDVASGNPYVTPEALREAMQRLRSLPERLQVIVGMRAFGWKYADIAEELGISRTRVNQLLRQADERLNELRERDLADRHPRTARLRELEDRPPPYLRSAIGRPPRPNRRRGGGTELLRDWRRLALAIDDHRELYGVSDSKRALGIFGRNADERRDRDLLRAQIDGFLQARERFNGLDR